MSLRWKLLALAAAVTLILSAVVLLPKPVEVDATSAAQSQAESGTATSAGADGEAVPASVSTPQTSSDAPAAAGGVSPVSAGSEVGAAPGGAPGGPAVRGTEGGNYVVQRGDTPASIARRYLGEAARWPEIASANPGLDARSLQVGQMLRLPAGAVPVATEAQQAKVGKGPATGPGGAVAGGAPLATHRVADGDSLYNLARRYYGDASHWKLIQDANPALLGEGVKGLRLDSELVIPALPGRRR